MNYGIEDMNKDEKQEVERGLLGDLKLNCWMFVFDGVLTQQTKLSQRPPPSRQPRLKTFLSTPSEGCFVITGSILLAFLIFW
jgi:hypothetical protein